MPRGPLKIGFSLLEQALETNESGGAGEHPHR
jgi:hypothetical protein